MSQTPLTRSTVYFGYGSNLWLHQMSQRCPSSTYLGIARLDNYRWMINSRGYANVVQVTNSTSPVSTTEENRIDYSSVVYGLVYTLTPHDEAALDRNEGVPIAYNKEVLDVEFWAFPPQTSSSLQQSSSPHIDVVNRKGKTGKMLVYIDRNRTEDAAPKKEYVYRMNMGIRDAVAEGMPEEYVDSVLRKFIPAGRDEEVRGVAERQALAFEDER